MQQLDCYISICLQRNILVNIKIPDLQKGIITLDNVLKRIKNRQSNSAHFYYKSVYLGLTIF